MMHINKSRGQREQMVKRRRKIALAIGLSFLFYLTLSFFLGEMGFFRYMKLKGQKQALTAEIAELKASNEKLGHKVESLKTDPDCIEGLAREQGLVKDGEKVYQYEGE
jgi:cell division protein FtsB